MLEDSRHISDSIFRAIESGNVDEVKKILEKDPSVLKQKNSNGLTPIFSAIQSGNLEIVNTIIEKYPSVLKKKDSNGLTPIFSAIHLGNLEIVNAIIGKYPSVLKKKDLIGLTPIFRAISKKNKEIVEAIIDADQSVLTQENLNCIKPIFSAIRSGNLEIVNTIIKKYPLVLKQKNSNLLTPIFLVIQLGSSEIVNTIIKEDLSVLKQEDSNGLTPIFYAISQQNKEIVEAIINADLSVLKKKDPIGLTPIFYAIYTGNQEIFEMIIQRDPMFLIKYADGIGNAPLPSATMLSRDSFCHDNGIGNTPLLSTTMLSRDSFYQDEDNRSKVSQAILKHQFPGTIDKASQEDFKELFLKKMLLKGIYSEENAPFYFKSLEKTIDKITPENTFKEIYQDLFNNVDKNQPIDSTKNEEMFIFQSNLKGHSSFFIFHVNKEDGKLTSISYCDGYEIDVERKIKDSATHINGVTTFHLKTPIGYNKDFVKNFIKENTQYKSPKVFYDKFKEKKLYFKRSLIEFSEITHSIPTKAQKRDNCSFKGPNLVVRKIWQQQNPGTIEYGFDTETKKPIEAGYDEYKKFKDGLTKNALDFIMKIKEKISLKSDPLSEYLKKEIEDIMKMVEKHNEKKLSKDDQPREEFHQEINHLLSKDDPPREEFHQEMNRLLFQVGRNKDEAPKPSCFSFLASCFSSDKTPKPSLSCFPFFASRLSSNKTPQQQAVPFIPF